ncbi:hypothetical protein [Paenibacillus sp. QZ-Y1]|uniref:hypothetical protein n=1 Tax=Paenibacillus sp. QZ-Y1 TaxID=3414511 RepID=UPI003F7AC390
MDIKNYADLLYRSGDIFIKNGKEFYWDERFSLSKNLQNLYEILQCFNEFRVAFDNAEVEEKILAEHEQLQDTFNNYANFLNTKIDAIQRFKETDYNRFNQEASLKLITFEEIVNTIGERIVEKMRN